MKMRVAHFLLTYKELGWFLLLVSLSGPIVTLSPIFRWIGQFFGKKCRIVKMSKIVTLSRWNKNSVKCSLDLLSQSATPFWKEETSSNTMISKLLFKLNACLRYNKTKARGSSTKCLWEGQIWGVCWKIFNISVKTLSILAYLYWMEAEMIVLGIYSQSFGKIINTVTKLTIEKLWQLPPFLLAPVFKSES